MAKHKTKSLANYSLAPAPLVIDIDGVTAGLAIQDERGFRFIAAHPRFDLLDGSFFRLPQQATQAARRLANAARA
jgi:hypothetical protein